MLISPFKAPRQPSTTASRTPAPARRPSRGFGPVTCCFAYANESRGKGGKATRGPLVTPLGPGCRSRCLLLRSLFLCAAFRGIKADTVVTRSPTGQRSDFTIPITMISNDVYLAGFDGWELYKKALLPSPLLGGPWVRGAFASAPAEGRCAAPGHRVPRPTRRRALGVKLRRQGGTSGVRHRYRAHSATPCGARGHAGIKRVNITVVYNEHYQALHLSLPIG